MNRSKRLKDFNYFFDKSLIIPITTRTVVIITTLATKVVVIDIAFKYIKITKFF